MVPRRHSGRGNRHLFEPGFILIQYTPMQIKYLCTYWGQEQLSAAEFIDKAIAEGYDGIEINIPPTDTFKTGFLWTLANLKSSNPEFIFVAQHVPDMVGEKYETHLKNLKI